MKIRRESVGVWSEGVVGVFGPNRLAGIEKEVENYEAREMMLEEGAPGGIVAVGASLWSIVVNGISELLFDREWDIGHLGNGPVPTNAAVVRQQVEDPGDSFAEVVWVWLPVVLVIPELILLPLQVSRVVCLRGLLHVR